MKPKINRNLLTGILTTLAMPLFITVPSVSAQTTLKATIPFAFTVGKTEMPAGTYTISPVSLSAIAIDSNTVQVFSLFQPEQARSGDGTPNLVFRKYGNTYFLSQVSPGFGKNVMQLPNSKLEKEQRIANGGYVSEQKTVIAAK